MNGIQEVSGSIPLISTISKRVAFENPFLWSGFLLCRAIPNTERDETWRFVPFLFAPPDLSVYFNPFRPPLVRLSALCLPEDTDIQDLGQLVFRRRSLRLRISQPSKKPPAVSNSVGGVSTFERG